MEQNGFYRRSFLHLQGNAQIAVDIVDQIILELNDKRFIQSVFLVCHFDLLRSGFLRQERAARNGVHQEECDRHDEDDRSNRCHQSFTYVD